MGAVLGDLAEFGYDAEWESIPAAAVGAPHLRYRVWIIGTRRPEQRRLLADADDGYLDAIDALRAGRGEGRGWWDVEPDVGRVAHGVPARVDRLRALGNAVVPQVVEWIGRQLLASIEAVA
jgi:DNA (cytosine-5)-methyltransferase 1